jgi:hypothetical protein
MNRSVVIFSNPFYGLMADIVSTAIVQNPMLCQAKAYAQDCMNAPSVKGNLQSQPKRRCTALNWRYGNSCLPCTTSPIQAIAESPFNIEF